MKTSDYSPKRAVDRLLDYYQYVMTLAGVRIAHHWSGPVPAAPPFAVPDLPDRGHALAWARAERANVVACIEAVGAGSPGRVVSRNSGALQRHGR